MEIAFVTRNIPEISVKIVQQLYMDQLARSFAMLHRLALTMVFVTLLETAFVTQTTLDLHVLNSVLISPLASLEAFVTVMVSVYVTPSFLEVTVLNVRLIIINFQNANSVLLQFVVIVVYVKVMENVLVTVTTLAHNVQSFVIRYSLVTEEVSVIIPMESVSVLQHLKALIVQVKLEYFFLTIFQKM
jgi:hypothetical protein